MKGIVNSVNIFMLISIIFFLSGVLIIIFALSGVAIAISAFSKLLFFIGVICLILSVVFYFFKKRVKLKMEEK